MNKAKATSRINYFILCLSPILLILILFVSAFAFNPNKANIDPSATKWVFHSEVKGVKIYYQINTCEKQSVVFLKFNNTNSKKVSVTWKEAFYTKQVPEEKDSHKGTKQLTLPPGETSQSDCSAVRIKECITFSHEAIPTYIADITEFKIKDIHVTTP
ncbi:hypothetical protein [Rufibacter sp. XAAS-G3-1]|uniref:hypothetical protein n=1 Tax=Rufibacter sp. XAAS-G3-1 TaxID=2729134 RepID=UPI0015E70023|nr:hypothetical protein [Rufibacter sp. XAAS-G3-1]